MNGYQRTDATGAAIDQWVMHQRASLLDVLSLCESPYEEQFVSALLCAWDGRGLIFALAPRELVARGHVAMADGVDVHLQREVAGYRLDLSLESKACRVCVEVDGHAYHERTKEQAAHDKRRDRALTDAGWKVYRFTASEVHRDKAGGVAQVLRAVGLEPKPYVPVPVTLVCPIKAKASAERQAAHEASMSKLRAAKTWEDELEALREVAARSKAKLGVH